MEKTSLFLSQWKQKEYENFHLIEQESKSAKISSGSILHIIAHAWCASDIISNRIHAHAVMCP